MEIVLPNYKDGSIVNLMSSIASYFGKRPAYAHLKNFPKISSKNIVLIVIDGLGYNYLMQNSMFLRKHIVSRLTTVFPATTAAAITTFATGLAPQQHGFTGWFMYLKELGMVATILNMCPRVGGPSYLLPLEKLNMPKPFTVKAQMLAVMPKDLANSTTNIYFHKNYKDLYYKTKTEFFRAIKKVVSLNNRRKFVYAYWPYFDALAHEFGLGKRTKSHLNQLEKNFRRLKLKDTTLIITADHGFANVKDVLWLEDHPKLKECLTLPLSGDSRVAYCYLHPSKVKQFETYVKNKLSKYCWLFKSQELIDKSFFGLYSPNPRLIERIGDYVIIMKDGNIIKDLVLGQKRTALKGNHSGVSEDEMYVPLVVL